MRLKVSRIGSPVGLLALAVDGDGRLRGVSFGAGLSAAMRREYGAPAMTEGDPPMAVQRAITRYFQGERTALAEVDWSLDGATSGDGFQARVWRVLADVPVGQTISYGEVARRAGEPGAAQAAGVALNRNPLPLVLACHRVVGAGGGMVGFGGGLERKTWLLRHEGALLL